jgi:hypothetical protein
VCSYIYISHTHTIHTYTHIHTHIHTYIHPYIHPYIHTYIHPPPSLPLPPTHSPPETRHRKDSATGAPGPWGQKTTTACCRCCCCSNSPLSPHPSTLTPQAPASSSPLLPPPLTMMTVAATRGVRGSPPLPPGHVRCVVGCVRGEGGPPRLCLFCCFCFVFWGGWVGGWDCVGVCVRGGGGRGCGG